MATLPRWLRLLVAALVVSVALSGFATTGVVIYQVDQIREQIAQQLGRLERIERTQAEAGAGLTERQEDRLQCLLFPLAQAHGFDAVGLLPAREHCAAAIEGWPPRQP